MKWIFDGNCHNGWGTIYYRQQIQRQIHSVMDCKTLYPGASIYE